MWKSEIWEGLDLQVAPTCGQNSAKLAAWSERVAQEPWIVGLRELTEQKGRWIGTEARLIRELRKRAGEEVSTTGDFPSSLDHLYEYMAIADEVFAKLELSIEDYREIPVEHFIYRFDVHEWGWDNPILVHRGDSALRKYYLRAWEHPDPLPLTLLLVVAKERSG
jgi:hypothetical protein